MNKSRVLLGVLVGVVLVVGTYSITSNRFDKHHSQEYEIHVSRAFTDVKLADQGIRDLQTRGGDISQQDVSNALLQMSNSLKAAEVEATSLQGYLTYHDDTNSGPSTSFLSELFVYYREVIDTRLRDSWQMKKGDAKWNSIQNDLQVIGEDLHYLAQADQNVFLGTKLSTIQKYWSAYTLNLKFPEVKKRYDDKYHH